MLSANDQRLRATQMAHESIQQLLDAGVSFNRVAEAYAAAAVKLVLAHAGREATHDLLTSLFMLVDQEEETRRHGPARP
jgi:hypothetical protein